MRGMFQKGTVAWYEAAYREMDFDKGYEAQILKVAKRILAGKPRYQGIEKATGVPWILIGTIHNMECSCDFRGVLHNGERIVGTGRKTSLVPKNRGPFNTWEKAALDAVKDWKWAQGVQWSLGLILKHAEAFNGLGYLKYHRTENSPYIWACTTINDGHGKYVADGKYSETAPSNGQVGVAAIIKQLEVMGELSLTMETAGEENGHQTEV